MAAVAPWPRAKQLPNTINPVQFSSRHRFVPLHMTPFAALSQKGRGSDFSCWCAANVMSVLLKFVKKSSAFGRYECAVIKRSAQSFIVDFLHIFRIGIGDGRLPATFPRLQVLDGSCQVLASTCQLRRAQLQGWYDHVPEEWFPAGHHDTYS